MKKILNTIRSYLLIVLLIILLIASSMRLMKIQIVNGDSYLKKSKTTSTQSQTISAPRGEILAADGSKLVSNKSCYNVIIDNAFFPDDNNEKNRVIIETVRILDKENINHNDILPLSTTIPLSFDKYEEKDITEMREAIGVQIYATADQALNAMCDKYGISREYTLKEQRIIAGVRYTMDKYNFSFANTFILAEDIPSEVVLKIKEMSYRLDGIDIKEDATRTYEQGDIIPHLIGTTGAINAEEYEALSEEGYSLDDTIGKSGIELAMESSLRGQKGTRTITMQDGEVIADKVTEAAIPGNTIKLTIDPDYQKKIQSILENHIYWLQNQTSEYKTGTSANAGAIVVLDAKSGALLAAATAPTYNLNDYIDDYTSVLNADNQPLVNRATSGLYRPGSTFKTIVATAALNENIITPNTYITCNNVYTYWEDYQPKCTGYHGSINVITALEKSCNIFFYETGRLTGINTIRQYAEMFGLGGNMGLEIGKDIQKGYIASPEIFDTLGIDWQAGNIVQAAIGQSETAVTPLQLATVAMTIANNGRRYNTYMVDSIYTYNMDELISKTSPSVACVITDKTGYTFDTVKEGMIAAANFEEYATYPRLNDYYTESYLLSDLPYSAAIKTGTPQMTSSSDTGSAFIGFYPADDPQIAFSGFIEHGEYSKFMIKDIIQAYFDENYEITDPGEVDYSKKVQVEEEETVYETEEEEYYYPDYDNYTDIETESNETIATTISEEEISETETSIEEEIITTSIDEDEEVIITEIPETEPITEESEAPIEEENIIIEEITTLPPENPTEEETVYDEIIE